MNNIKNILITKEIIEEIINKYTEHKVIINNLEKFQIAFIHKSFCHKNEFDLEGEDQICFITLPKHCIKHNERLELLGDRVIDLITTEYLFDKFPDKPEGFITPLKHKFVKKSHLAYLGDKIGLKKYLLISSYLERNQNRENNERLMEDNFESFIGALYKDQNNLEICKNFLFNLYEKFVDLEYLVNTNDNYKGSLLKYFHIQKWGNPVYIVSFILGGEVVQNRKFISTCFVSKELINEPTDKLLNNQKIYLEVSKKEAENDKELENFIKAMEYNYILGYGKSTTKKNAEQICSKECLLNLDLPLNF